MERMISDLCGDGGLGRERRGDGMKGIERRGTDTDRFSGAGFVL